MRLILTAFSFLLAATASAQEVGGSFDLGGKTTSDLKFDMVAVSDVDGKNDCSAYGEGAIGMDDKGLILSCQSSGSQHTWKSLGGNEVDYTDCRQSPSISHWSGTNYLSQCPSQYIAIGLYAWAGGASDHTRVTAARCCKLK